MFFFFNDTATTEIYTLSLHDALPISAAWSARQLRSAARAVCEAVTQPVTGVRWYERARALRVLDRKSTRLNSSHANISYAVFCLKKKNKHTHPYTSI